MVEIDQLIRTKLHMPFTRSGLVSRPRLQEQIVQGLCGPLTLITAPAGFGKTTLVVSTVTQWEMPAAWLSLDKEDNDTLRFLKYLITAIREIDGTIGNEAAQLLAVSQQTTPEIILTSLINDLDSVSDERILVLDDYHQISNPEVHGIVTFLLDHCPKHFHLLISTRSDPPLPFARLRARGQAVELRAADLRFTEAEAAIFLNDIMDLQLSAGSVTALEERTEGWIAGLQMASIAMKPLRSMHPRVDVPAFIQGFSGTNRYVLDYLLEEVLANQPPEIQRFLLITSILNRLTAHLCDALLADDEAPNGETDSGSTFFEATYPSRSASILAHMERANLFLIPLDDERRWFRYHHLFSDLLRARLALSQKGHYQKLLHARASKWYETNGFAEESIHHALASGDTADAARLIEAAAETAWLDGQYTKILAWVKELPVSIVRSRPWLCIWCAWAYTQMGERQRIQEWVEAAEQSAANVPQDDQALMNEIAALKVFAVSFSKNYNLAIGLAEDALKNPPSRHERASQLIRCNILHVLSSMYFSTGKLEQSEQICRETIDLSNRIGFTLRYIHAINKLVLIYTQTGRLAASEQVLEEAQSVLREQGNSRYFAAILLQIRMIDLLCEWNRLDDAQHIVDSILGQETLVEIPYLVVEFSNVHAVILQAKRDYAGAQALLYKAVALAQNSYIWEGLSWHTKRLQIKLWLQKGDIAQAAFWASKQEESISAALPMDRDLLTLVQARISMAKRDWQKAISLLDRLNTSANAGGRKRTLIEIHALKALAFQGEGKKDRAGGELERALALAASERYVRTFIDEGKPMQTLIACWLEHSGGSLFQDYASHLLSQFGSEPSWLQPKQEPSSQIDLLVEPLSQRELEVLHLMSFGLTNSKIARQLIVATGTIKAHAASIYRKLDVANRTEAVSRARQLGILP